MAATKTYKNRITVALGGLYHRMTQVRAAEERRGVQGHLEWLVMRDWIATHPDQHPDDVMAPEEEEESANV